MKPIQIRLETPTDYSAVELLTREAFWNHHVPGCDEHYLVHVMRDANAFVKALAYVATDGSQILGNIMYTTAFILGDDGQKHPVLCFGPLSVLPQYQGQGIGTQLIEHTKKAAKELGYTAIVIYGDPVFYKRVGFVPAESFGIGTSQNTYAAALLACPLIPDGLKDCSGRFLEDSIFEINKSDSEAFDATFPPKTKETGLASQERFLQLVGIQKPRLDP